MKTALGFILTSILWAVVWGTAAYLAVLVGSFFNPDFGHMGPELSAIIFGLVCALGGGVTGLTFVFASWMASPKSRRARVGIGGASGLVAGLVGSTLVL